MNQGVLAAVFSFAQTHIELITLCMLHLVRSGIESVEQMERAKQPEQTPSSHPPIA